MNSCLLDTNILVRLANPADALFPLAASAVIGLQRQSIELFLTPQVLVEFRNVATRDTKLNGLGLNVAKAEAMISDFETEFFLLPEYYAIYPAWKSLVSQLGVIGKQVHDARLAAVCQVHGVQSLLTFNVQHFQRFTTAISGFQVVDPASV